MDSTEKIKVLYIDDEMNNLVGFKAAFRVDYNVLIANSAEEGIRLLEKHPDLKIIFCDQRMPDKTGVQFFEEAAQINPQPIRMLLTGYVDIESVIEAINKGHIFRYLTKPWQEADVRAAIEEGYKYYVTSSALAVKNLELQKANEELDKFAYSVTHDVRGPIVSMMGALEIMRSMDDVEQMKEIAEMMQQSVEKVNDFIENIHSYYSLKRGNLNIQEIDLDKLINDVVSIQQVNARLNNVSITTRTEQNEPYRNDHAILQMIINNLLSNAVKYQRNEETDKFVQLSATVKNGSLKMTVEDNGIGIDNQYLNDIFKMFFRATSENLGSGFGLYNVKDAINRLNGEISVTSEVNKGSVFTVSVPGK